jgi:hypothetical protein
MDEGVYRRCLFGSRTEARPDEGEHLSILARYILPMGADVAFSLRRLVPRAQGSRGRRERA